MTRSFVIVGASGDLAGRHLLPAFAELVQAGKLSTPFTIVGIAPEPWDQAAFRRHAERQLSRHSKADPDVRHQVLSCLDYRSADVTDSEQLGPALASLTGPMIVYLALPPNLFAPAIMALAATVGDRASLVIEKPFGESLESVRALNRLLHQTYSESAVFRIDHFLGMRTVQNILGMRFGNRIFEPTWTHQHVERIELIWDETLALEGRASYYDRAGALRDMVQNHLLQLLCLIGMEPPRSVGAQDLRDRKVDVLRAVKGLSPDEVEQRTVRGRYIAGRIGTKRIPAYVEEPGIDPSRETETFVQLTLFVDNGRWAGVPFLLRSGKALARDRKEILIHFKPAPYGTFGPQTPVRHNRFRIQLNPDWLNLHVNVTGADELFCLNEISLEKELARQSIPSYGQLLLDILEGDHTLSIRHDEAEESWRIVEPILEAWAKGRSPLREYPAGSEGPHSTHTYHAAHRAA